MVLSLTHAHTLPNLWSGLGSNFCSQPSGAVFSRMPCPPSSVRVNKGSHTDGSSTWFLGSDAFSCCRPEKCYCSVIKLWPNFCCLLLFQVVFRQLCIFGVSKCRFFFSFSNMATANCLFYVKKLNSGPRIPNSSLRATIKTSSFISEIQIQ